VTIEIPNLCLVALIGPSGSGKSTFARSHFKPTEVVSSDFCRGLVCDDENSLEATADAFDVLRYVVDKRLSRGLLTVIDATSVRPEDRAVIVEQAREHDVLAVAIVLNLPERLCHDRNAARPDRQFGPHVVRNQASALRRSLRGLGREGFRQVFVLDTPELVTAAQVTRVPLWTDRRHDRGPFDIVGDVHGCYDELCELLVKLGYDLTEPQRVVPPPGRKLVFLGDLVDRGPKVLEVLGLVRSMVARGTALCVPGNHDVKLLRKLQGKNVQITHGLDATLQQMDAIEPPASRAALGRELAAFIDGLVSHYVLDEGRLAVSHAGLKERYVGRSSRRVREFCLYGETTGETDEFGLPERINWAAEYRGRTAIVYGHTPVPEADWLNNTINLDTGCVFGGKLTALRWPEKQVVSVPARQVYAAPARPLAAVPAALSPQQAQDTLLDVADVLGKRVIETRLHAAVTVPAENAAAALEVMSRFAIDPRWLIYLPPTMSPVATSQRPDLLEHPDEAFAYFRDAGVSTVVCEEKHMGSRAVAVVTRDASVACRRFGIDADRAGVVYTRTGRPFFDAPAVEAALLERLAAAITAAGWWEQFASDWFCLDCELMPWSAKAQALLEQQYAPVGAAADASLARAESAVAGFLGRTELDAAAREAGGLIAAALAERRRTTHDYVAAYRRYCWGVDGITGLKLAPFHLLASEGKVHVDRDHLWHMATLGQLARDGDPLFVATQHRSVALADPASVAAAVEWWESLTAAGGEGMVVKPLEFVVRGSRGLVQPAVKVRGREYLRIIYGPEYTLAANLPRLRARSLGRKRGLAVREFALGVESLERFVAREPLRRVHECVFAVLASESEPVDPRL
jgi:protein phosphatase